MISERVLAGLTCLVLATLTVAAGRSQAWGATFLCGLLAVHQLAVLLWGRA